MGIGRQAGIKWKFHYAISFSQDKKRDKVIGIHISVILVFETHLQISIFFLIHFWTRSNSSEARMYEITVDTALFFMSIPSFQNAKLSQRRKTRNKDVEKKCSNFLLLISLGTVA